MLVVSVVRNSVAGDEPFTWRSTSRTAQGTGIASRVT